MLILSDYTYHCPSTAAGALALLQEGGTLIAGGSDVMPQLKTAVISPKALIDLSRIDELKVLEEREDGIHIGSMVTLAHLAKSALILSKVPALSEAARNVASPQIRNRGTVGGNILQARRCIYYNQTKEWRQGIPACFKTGGDRCIQIANSSVCRAIYYSDMAPALLAYGAEAVVSTERGEEIRSCQSIIDAHTADLREQYILKEFIIPRAEYGDVKAGFCKHSLRGSIDFPIINFAYSYRDDCVRLFMGAMSVNIVELTETEKYLTERKKEFEVEEAYRIASGEARKKSQLIHESGISVQVKRGAASHLQGLLEELKRSM